MATTAQAMSTFLESLTATDYQTDTFIPARKNSVVKNLTACFPTTSDMPFADAKLIGSAAKNTIIRPFDDIDVLAIFSNVNNAWTKYRYDSKSFMYRIRNAYDGVHIQQVGSRGQAVRVFFQQGGHVDVAPVFDYGSGNYALPDGSGGWLTTAPLKAADWFKTQNQSLGYHVAPVVRLAKAWNRAHSRRLKSYHLETLVASGFTSIGSNYRSALCLWFDWASRNLSVNDPGGHSGDLSAYLGWTQLQDVIRSLTRAHEQATRAQEAEADGDHAEAKRLWKIILGDDFPTA